MAGLAGATRHHSSCPTSLDKPCWTRELHYVSCWINPIAEQHTLNVGFMSDKCRGVSPARYRVRCAAYQLLLLDKGFLDTIMFRPGDPLVHCDSHEAQLITSPFTPFTFQL